MHLASTLLHMHMQRPTLVHQDLHRGNVLCSRDNKTWMLIDFGAASWTHHQGTSIILSTRK